MPVRIFFLPGLVHLPYITYAKSTRTSAKPRGRQRHQGELSVVIAYDVRHYQDLRKLYPKDVPNPVLGFTSRDFAELAAGVYAANGVVSTMLDRGDDSYISTPELSFAIRHLGTKGGLNVSASHNPPDDNGAKIYNQLGGQEIPPYTLPFLRQRELFHGVK